VSHWRSGWKFWPDSPKGPVDDAFRQVAWVRPYRVGFPRVAAVVLLGLLVSYVASGGVLVLFSPGPPLLERGLFALVMLPVAVGLGVLVGRLFASGVYVNDEGLRLVTARRTLTARWPEVVDVSDVEGGVGLLGLPAPRLPGRVVVVTLRDLGPVRTPLTSAGPDFLGRAEAYAMAAGAVERWWRDAGSLC
jgi:hypothetical protein